MRIGAKSDRAVEIGSLYNYMATPQNIQNVLEQKQVRLRQLEAPYLRAIEYFKTLDWQKQRDQTLMKIQEATAFYQGKDATEAVFILGKVKTFLLGIQEQGDVVVEYEGLKREIETYYQTRG